MPFSQDVLTRIFNVHWETVLEQQGLVAEYPFATDEVFGIPVAHAIDTGQTFPGVNMGASGLGYTVLTLGLVCFGTPRNGDACFMAAPDFNMRSNNAFVDSPVIKRGLVEDGEIKWEVVGGGKGLVALSFAGGAFFAIYISGEFNGGARIETSFDGKTWSSKAVFPEDRGSFGGSVANNGSGKEPGAYACAGYVVIDPDDFDDGGPTWSGPTYNLAWASAPPPHDDTVTTLDFHYDQADGMEGQPGSYLGGGTSNFNFGSTVGGGKKAFVAAGTVKNNMTLALPAGQLRRVPGHTAAACFSSNGTSWEATKLPGATESDHIFSDDGDSDAGSYGTCATFIHTTPDDGYFLCGQYGYTWSTVGGVSTASNNTSIYKSDDGFSWSEVFAGHGDSMFLTVSAIARDLNATTIVTI